MSIPDPKDDESCANTSLPTPSPTPSPLTNSPQSSPLDFRFNVAKSRAQTNNPAVHAPGLEKEDPRNILNGTNLAATTLVPLQATTPFVQVLEIQSPSTHEHSGSTKEKQKPPHLPDFPNRPRKLSGAQVVELTSQPLSPKSIPQEIKELPVPELIPAPAVSVSLAAALDNDHESSEDSHGRYITNGIHRKKSGDRHERERQSRPGRMERHLTSTANGSRPSVPTRTVSTPPLIRRKKSYSKGHENLSRSKGLAFSPPPPNAKERGSDGHRGRNEKLPTPPSEDTRTPITATVPIPSLSLPTYLQLELAADPRSSYFSRGSDFMYESSAVKLERLRNFLILPLYLEQLLWFGATACLDAWLYTFTILPLRFLKALSLLVQWWFGNAGKEVYDLVEFVYLGVGRLWKRRQSRDGTPRSEPASREPSRPRKSSMGNGSAKKSHESNGVIHAWPTTPKPLKRKDSKGYRHRRTRSTPSLLQASHKADLLKGLLVIICSIFLMNLDPSRIYHNVRGQSAVKLYVIYNALEVC
jgi:Eukaryotic membrane protein family